MISLILCLAAVFIAGFVIGDAGHDDNWRWPDTAPSADAGPDA